MTARETRRADQIQPGQYVIDAGVLQYVTFVQHARSTVLIVYANNWAECGRPERLVALAGADEVFTAAAEAQATGKKLWNFPGLSRNVGTVEQVFGPMYADKPAGEFGPDNLDDLVDAALAGSKPALQELATGPYGFAPPTGHKTAATEDAYRADRYSEGAER